MRFTFNWLKQHLDTSLSLGQIASKLNEIGLEVEEIKDNAKIYQKFVVARVLATSTHPNAEKLRICDVQYGDCPTIQVICGAANARAGIIVALALPGAVVPANGMIIKKSVIRGVESNGMLCSLIELGLSSQDSGHILELEEGKIGNSLIAELGLDDAVIDIALTPNRGDCASVFGVARDLAAADAGSLKTLQIQPIPSPSAMPLKAHLEAQKTCFEFAYRYVANVNNVGLFSSPAAASLKASGYEPKSKLVDISNFVMFDLGRPNHLYDADKIEGDIVIRESRDTEKFLALNGNEYCLPAGILVIADAKKILSIAGVIGGMDSKIDLDTKNILIEVANFSADAVTAASRLLSIRTEASFRFERHVDPANTELVLDALSSAIASNCPSAVFSSKQYLRGAAPHCSDTVKFDVAKIEQISGMSLSTKDVLDVLQRLGFTHTNQNVIHVPSWRRSDVRSIADLAEEFLRMRGMAGIPAIRLPDLATSQALSTEADNWLLSAQHRLLDRNMHEVISWSFAKTELAEKFASDNNNLISIKNPIHSEMSVMRPSIFCTLIPIIEKNNARSIHNIAIFEVGAVYGKHFSMYQMQCLAGLRTGFYTAKGAHTKQRAVDFFDVKDDVMAALSEFGIDVAKYKITQETPSYYHPGRSACFKLGHDVIAYCGELHPAIKSQIAITQHTCCGFEIFLDALPNTKKKSQKNKLTLHEYQPVQRDLAFVLKKNITGAEVMSSIYALNIDILEQVEIFDVYESSDAEQKSLALSLRIQPKQSTLRDQDIEKIISQVVTQVFNRCGATLRS